jgi:hypothetical protein
MMALTTAQIRQLKSKLEAKHVKMRKANGIELHYVEGWYVIAEANRIFGYDAWDRRTLKTRCVWSGARGSYHEAAYTAKVRVSVRAGETTVVREGSGSCDAKAPTPGQAHELALKGAETDATKRALATFGNPFGLALYDREQAGVRKSREKTAPALSLWVLRSPIGAHEGSFGKPSEFATALRQAMSEAKDIEILFALWEQNVETVRALNRALRQDSLLRRGIAPQLVSHLKQCAIALVKAQGAGQKTTTASLTEPEPPDSPTHGKIDKSALTISEPKRHRSKEHLRFVAQQPCLICGRSPSQAHHIRFAQSRGLGLKVSDEYTVPLCAIHHSQNHAKGNERLWWQQYKIDPLATAKRLWEESLADKSATAGPASPKCRE